MHFVIIWFLDYDIDMNLMIDALVFTMRRSDLLSITIVEICT